MPIRLVTNDIVAMRVGAVVNAANNQLAMGGGVCGAIFRAAGASELSQECQAIGGCKTGQAVITSGHGLPAGHIIHTVGPVWYGGGGGERDLLASCYSESLGLARRNDIGSVAFPLISAGIFGYPRDQAALVALEAIGAYLLEDPAMEVFLVILGSRGEFVEPDLLSNIYKIEYQAVPDPGGGDGGPVGSRIADLMSLRGLRPRRLAALANMSPAALDKILYGEPPDHPTLLALAIALDLPVPEADRLLAAIAHWPHEDRRRQLAFYFLDQGICDIHRINLNNFALDFDTLP